MAEQILLCVELSRISLGTLLFYTLCIMQKIKITSLRWIVSEKK